MTRVFTDGNGVLDIYENMSSDNTDNVSGSNVGVTPNVASDDLGDFTVYIEGVTDDGRVINTRTSLTVSQ